MMVLSSANGSKYYMLAGSDFDTACKYGAFLVSPVFACESANAVRFDLTCSVREFIQSTQQGSI